MFHFIFHSVPVLGIGFQFQSHFPMEFDGIACLLTSSPADKKPTASLFSLLYGRPVFAPGNLQNHLFILAILKFHETPTCRLFLFLLSTH